MALLGWYSLPSAISIHAVLEATALVFFAALVVFDICAHLNKKREHLLESVGLVCFGIAVLAEICAYPYSRRIDTLSNEANVATEQRIAALNKEAADARKQAEDEAMARIQLATSISWRTPDRALITQLAPSLQRFAGQRYVILSDQTEPERSSVVGWLVALLTAGKWKLETAHSASELTFPATNIVSWLSPTAPKAVIDAARVLVPILEQGGLAAAVLQSAWGPQPDVAPPELIRVVVLKKGPRMTVNGNVITFEGSPARMFFGSSPPH